MKKNILYILIASLVIAGLSSCSDWLDVDPIGQNLEDKQYSSERGINETLNGIYMRMLSGAYNYSMSKTHIEQLAHYYYVPTTATPGNEGQFANFARLQRYDYEDEVIESYFKSIWTNLYGVSFNINNFISNVEGTTVITPERRDVLLGEAYALRAFVHLDIFRLFGPIYSLKDDAAVLPYNDKSTLEVYEYISAEEFMNKVLADIAVAEALLQNDPILSSGILNPLEAQGVNSLDKFAEYGRNKRMNIVAVKALHARALAVADRLDEAADLASDIIKTPDLIEDINGVNSKAVFQWIKPANANVKKDLIFSTEVLFSIDNQNLITDWNNITIDKTELGSAYALHKDNLFSNILNQSGETSIYLMSDYRARQWIVANALSSDMYFSQRYSYKPESTASQVNNMQPMIRMTELYYLILENQINKGDLAGATNLANSILVRRGYKEHELFTDQLTEEKANDFLLREYYREFYAEGQTFFFLKRRASDKVFNSGAAGSVSIELSNYVVPIPTTEINN